MIKLRVILMLNDGNIIALLIERLQAVKFMANARREPDIQLEIVDFTAIISPEY